MVPRKAVWKKKEIKGKVVLGTKFVIKKIDFRKNVSTL